MEVPFSWHIDYIFQAKDIVMLQMPHDFDLSEHSLSINLEIISDDKVRTMSSILANFLIATFSLFTLSIADTTAPYVPLPMSLIGS
jgi:hypothetical protein